MTSKLKWVAVTINNSHHSDVHVQLNQRTPATQCRNNCMIYFVDLNMNFAKYTEEQAMTKAIELQNN